MSSKQFSHFILPGLSKLFVQMQPPEIPLELLEHFELMMNKAQPAEQQNFILPFLVRCLENKTPDVQIEAMKQAEKNFTGKHITAQDFKSLLLPKIETVIRRAQSSMLRINGAVCLGKVSHLLEEKLQIQVAIPCLEHCLSMDASPGLVMTVVGVFNRIAKNLEHKHIVALRILPAVFPVLVNTALNEDQFGKIMRTVKGMVAMVEQQRLETFESASALARETKHRRNVENMHDRQQEQKRYSPSPPQTLREQRSSATVTTNDASRKGSLVTDDLFDFLTEK